MTIAIDHEPGTSVKDPEIRVIAATDTGGGKVQWGEEPELAGGSRSVSTVCVNGRTVKIVSDGQNFRVIMDSAAPDAGQKIALRDIPGPVDRFQTLQCAASMVIPTGSSRKVSFEKPKAGDTRTVGPVEVAIEEVGDGWIEVAVRAKEGGKVARNLLNEDSLVVRSGDEDCEAELQEEEEDTGRRNPEKVLRRFRREQGLDSGKAEFFIVKIPRRARGSVDALEFSLREILRHTVQFEFKDLDVR